MYQYHPILLVHLKHLNGSFPPSPSLKMVYLHALLSMMMVEGLAPFQVLPATPPAQVWTGLIP